MSSAKRSLLRRALGFVLLTAGLASCGYAVDGLSGEVNSNALELAPGDTFTFQQVFETPCDSAIVVGAYTTDEQRDALVGKASVSMEARDAFVLAVAFDAEGNRVAASRLDRQPVDFDWLAGQAVPCDEAILINEDNGQPVRRG